MSCICKSPVRPSFKDSYKDLLDKPQINGVPLDGDVKTDDLHINYPHLAGLPQINGVTLTGNLTPAALGIKAGAQFKIVPRLPVTDIDEATIYLVPVQVGQTDNIYQEWIYINNKWEKIGEPISIEGSGGITGITNVQVKLPSKEITLYTIDSFNQYSNFRLEDNKIYAANSAQGAGVLFSTEDASGNCSFEAFMSFSFEKLRHSVGPEYGIGFVDYTGLIYTVRSIVVFMGNFISIET